MRVFFLLNWLIRKVFKLTSKIDARIYSNKLLKRYLKYFGGNIINVSGWEDSDKQGGFYAEYYKDVLSYTISNIDGINGTPETKKRGIDYIYLDLDKPIVDVLNGIYDVVFNHTVLEHVFNLSNALDVISSLSKDVIITIVPFSQPVHYTESYGDYHRVTPRFLEQYFYKKGYTTILSDFNDQPFFHIYVINISTKYPDKYKGFFKNAPMNFDINIHPNKKGKMK